MPDDDPNFKPDDQGDDAPDVHNLKPGAKPEPSASSDDDDDAAGGKRAVLADLARERKERKAAQAELEKLRKASMTDQEKAVAEAEARGRLEATKEMASSRLRDRVELAASGRLANPKLAPGLLGDLEQYLAEDGNIDEQAIKKSIDDLLKTDPYLAPGAKPGALPGGGAKPSSNGQSMDDWLRGEAQAKRG